MAIVYCDWAAGNDTTGDGSAGNPYKTITKASTGLTGGDEVRVAKSPARTPISVPLSWTNGSRTVTGAGDLTSEIAQYDIIAKASAGGPGDSETVYEVGTISYSADTDTTTITLGTNDNHKYVGTTETAASVLINATDTGVGTTTTQVVSASGLGNTSLLTISGGWTLSGTPVQDGETWFVQRDTTPATKTGYGLVLSGKEFVQVTNLGFLRYDRDISCTNSWGCVFADCTSVSGATSGYHVDNSHGMTVRRCCASACGSGFYQLFSSTELTVENSVAYGCDLVGLRLSDGARLLTVSGCRLAYNSTAVRSNGGTGVTLLDTTLSGNGEDVRITNTLKSPRSVIRSHNHGAAGKHKSFTENAGVVERDTATYRGASGESLKITPISAHLALVTRDAMDDWFVAQATSGEDLTLSIYAKAGATWNGKCWLEGVINGRSCVGPIEKTLTTDWAEYTVTIPAACITETGPIASLRIYVTGTVGVVNLDDFSWSSAAP